MTRVTIVSQSAAQTARLAQKLSRLVLPGSVLALSGELGAGKTTFVQGFAKGLAIKQSVKSPTFVFLHVYQGGRYLLYHFDLYRVEKADDLNQIGFSDYIHEPGAVAVVEWAEKAGAALPADFIKIVIQMTGQNKRRLTLSGTGLQSDKILKQFTSK
ncbi:MAG: tRNA (adenosine(37)-N6)-threonylcarbamoyltransferase complex ATPase subunit type 1 TsaE [Candidatus Omnitrophica bacterium CG11_big_fil_rev_8_21_14_0_20_45_26]|uniref:tRNA threonylcarbamoyladenosine biosynthesis protein TsaE n=1 Tax=Candidatus Abzuiibacterium crystallinum TaxID=1974748 RepID=A0A2H0LPI4_9BACT|nr:MAG: tRNA (adenosine(37)-N6)-threonylcarbamoyltransferase complex ATPase subunit type 1 TsaE [Candidatus Omnitrophica bacterium CG11_big_fil_rev_8_21_14_0_20_45_26]PIW63536.1 MAG: tRNA (adenosine(37)-N6)-threonylcarbamoyltransferase complex ATPase subunit type 1 TsaE [Candidatus Omnitrophica bacterium CG12_big_fil_rev_8_21_14_0_65_45_16]